MKNHCIDCKCETKGRGKRCYTCSKLGTKNPMYKTHNFFGKRLPAEVLFKIRKNPSGKLHWNYKGGGMRFPKCIDCGQTLHTIKAIRCRNCKDKFYSGKKSPRFGKIYHPKYIRYKHIWFHSSYENNFARWCCLNYIKWQYEPKTFNLGNTTYTPDFYLPEYDIYIEIKGYWRDDAKKKFNLFRKRYNKQIKVFTNKDLNNIGIMV